MYWLQCIPNIGWRTEIQSVPENPKYQNPCSSKFPFFQILSTNTSKPRMLYSKNFNLGKIYFSIFTSYVVPNNLPFPYLMDVLDEFGLCIEFHAMFLKSKQQTTCSIQSSICIFATVQSNIFLLLHQIGTNGNSHLFFELFNAKILPSSQAGMTWRSKCRSQTNNRTDLSVMTSLLVSTYSVPRVHILTTLPSD